MRSWLRWLMAVGVSVLGLTVVGSGLASFTPTFSASTATDGVTVLGFGQGASDDPPALWQVYSPADYITNNGQLENSRFGAAVAKTTSGAKMAGWLTGAVATTPFGSATMADAATACTGTPTHDGYWIMSLSSSGGSLQVPVILDQIFGATNPLAAISSYRLTVCLPPPPAQTLSSATLTLVNVWSATPGWYLWRMLATPYTAGTKNTAGAAEAEALDRLDQELSLTVTGKGTARTASGRLTAGGNHAGVAKATVDLMQGGKSVGQATTDAKGNYKASLTNASRGVLRAVAVVPAQSTGACTGGTPFAPAPCVSAQVFGFTAKSPLVHLG